MSPKEYSPLKLSYQEHTDFSTEPRLQTILWMEEFQGYTVGVFFTKIPV